VAKSLRILLVAPITLGMTSLLWAQPEKGPELLEFVRDAHAASRDAIRTCSCRVEFQGKITSPKSKPPRDQSYSGRFWYSPEAVRAQVSIAGQEREYLWKDSIREGMTRASLGNKTGLGAGRQRFTNRYQPPCDAWMRGLLVLNLPNSTEYFPFEQLVERATRVGKVQKRSVDGKELIVAQLFFDRQEKHSPWDVEIYFDSSVNYFYCASSFPRVRLS